MLALGSKVGACFGSYLLYLVVSGCGGRDPGQFLLDFLSLSLAGNTVGATFGSRSGRKQFDCGERDD
ncbi:hypothetical protein BH11PLA2_BH11PLA2_07850 [soil metagenome]